MLYLHNIINGVWLIEPNFAMSYYPIIYNWITQSHEFSRPRRALEEDLSEDNAIKIATIKNDVYKISDYGEEVRPEDAREQSVALITINGAITKADQDCGSSGMETKSNILERCYENDNIKAVVLKIDSGGGEANAMVKMSDMIDNRNKPVVAFLDDCTASAAYGIASGCDQIVANNNLCQVGSIGTYMTITDFTEYYKKQGINIIEVYASRSTSKNKEFYEAIKGNVEPLREMCDRFNESFINSVKKKRKCMCDTEKTWSTGKLFFADDAIKNGLIDSVDSLDNVLNFFNI